VLLSAHSATALAALAARWRDRLAGASPVEAAALARGAARHRDLLPHRLAVRGADGAALAASLTGPARTEGVAVQGAVCFVFSGNGAQHAGMARAALRASAPFRRAMAEVDAALAPLLGWSPLARLRSGITAEALAATDIAQPLLFAIQVAMLSALQASGAFVLLLASSNATAGTPEPGAIGPQREFGLLRSPLHGIGEGAHPQPGAEFQLSLSQPLQGG
jgi:acyl transferase domain-containing protein